MTEEQANKIIKQNDAIIELLKFISRETALDMGLLGGGLMALQSINNTLGGLEQS